MRRQTNRETYMQTDPSALPSHSPSRAMIIAGGIVCFFFFSSHYTTVEPLSNDHLHQRPSLLYDHILCDGHCFLFVRSLTNDHPSDATNYQVRWDFLPRERPPRLQCISKNRGWRFNIRSHSCRASIITMLCL